MRSLLARLFNRPAPTQHVKIVEIVGEADWHWRRFRMKSCDARDQVACTAAARGWQAFEAPTPRYFADAVRRADGLVVDVGANTGFYTLLALAVSADVTVAAYEPLEPVRAILAANLRLNPERRRSRVLPYAVSDVDGARQLFVPDGKHGIVETSASLAAGFKAGAGVVHTVQATTLDLRHTGAPRVAVLKVDAESHDLEVLRGATSVLKRDRPVVFVEVLLGADEAGLTTLLNQCRYVDCVLRPEGATPPGREVRHDTLAWNHMWVPEENAIGHSAQCEIQAGPAKPILQRQAPFGASG